MIEHESQAVPYVLGELDDVEAATFERHLATCAECTAAVAEASDGLAELAFASAEEPPAELRARTLEAAAELPQVASLRPKRSFINTLSIAAAVALVVFGGLFLLNRQSDTERILASAQATSIAIDPTEAYEGAAALVEVVYLAESGEAVLVVDGLDAAPAGTTYEAWFIGSDGPRPAGLFQAGAGREQLLLEADYRPGDAVGITIEPAGGSEAPTGAVLFLGTEA